VRCANRIHFSSKQCCYVHLQPGCLRLSCLTPLDPYYRFSAVPNEQPFLLPPNFEQVVVAREADGGAPDQWDMNTLNETGRQAGRFLYRSHETLTDGAVSVKDLRTGETRVLVQRVDWNRMDGMVCTPWRTILTAEEMRPERTPSLPDPENPQALAGLVFEINPSTGSTVARPALGAKAHEGMRFDTRGNVYGISENLHLHGSGDAFRC
jgi:hypothetical protein